MYSVYSILFALAAVLTGPYWLIRGLREKKYLHNFRQRLGWGIPRLAGDVRPLWLHAVSVGEVLAAKALFTAIRKARPALPIVISTITITGQALARKEMAGAAAIFYFPFDWSFSVRRFLKRIQPRAVILLETELWPHFLRECRLHGVCVMLANGRVSDRAARGYRLIPHLTRSMLSNLALLGVQTDEDKRRFLQMGACDQQVTVTGSLKFDFSVPVAASGEELLAPIRNVLSIQPDTPVVVAGSTMKGEEPHLLNAFRRLRAEFPAARLILAPRHPERFAEIAGLLATSGLPFGRRSLLSAAPTGGAEILLLDTIGELRTVYSLASVAVIGGSFLASHGGHNPLEPAALGKPVVFGPYMSNFKEIAGLFVREHAARQCRTEELPEVLLGLARNPAACQLLGQRAAEVLRFNRGAAEKTLKLILPCIG
jgi:3-deoxy-D-manno-octulosonic-acid transferase